MMRMSTSVSGLRALAHVASQLCTGCVLTSLLFGCSGGEKSEEPEQLGKIGLQLYTLRAQMREDLEGTLRRVAATGYEEVEFAGLFGNDPVEVKALLDELGLDAVANHVEWSTFNSTPQVGIDETLALGSRYIVFAWLPGGQRSTIEQWEGWVQRFNELGQMARDAGLQFVYHNHEFEFEPLDGVRPYDLIMEGIDRDVVQLEMDFYWLALGGEEPRTWFERYPGGFPLSHVKDMSLGEDRAMVDVGEGRLDFGSSFAMQKQSGMQHYFVEHDESADPFLTIEKSYEYLRQLSY